MSQVFDWCLSPDLSANNTEFIVFHCNQFFFFLPIFSENTVRMGLEEEGRCAASMLFVFYLKIHYSCHPNEAIYNIFWELLLSIVLWVCEGKASFSVPFLIIMSSSYVVWNVWQIWYNTCSIFSIIWIPFGSVFLFFGGEKWWSELFPSLLGITMLPLRNSGYKIQNWLLARSVLLLLGRLLS